MSFACNVSVCFRGQCHISNQYVQKMTILMANKQKRSHFTINNNKKKSSVEFAHCNSFYYCYYYDVHVWFFAKNFLCQFIVTSCFCNVMKTDSTSAFIICTFARSSSNISTLHLCQLCFSFRPNPSVTVHFPAPNKSVFSRCTLLHPCMAHSFGVAQWLVTSL